MKKILFVLLISLYSIVSTQAQCLKGEHDCWVSEAVANIDASDFKSARKALKQAKKKVSSSQKDVAKKLLSKLASTYEPLIKYREIGKEKRNARLYKEALSHLNKGKILAERNNKTSIAATQELDEALIEYFISNIPIVEQERKTAIDDSNKKAKSSFTDGNYEAALVLYEFIEREALDSEPIASEASKKVNECNFFIAYQKAGDAYDSGNYKMAYEFAQKALKYNSSDLEAKRIRDDAKKEVYKGMHDEAKDMENTGGENCEEAIKIYENAKKYFSKDLVAEGYKTPELGIADAKECTSKYYLEKALSAHGSNNYSNALDYIKKAKYFSTTVTVDYIGDEYNCETLITKFFEDKKEEGEKFYTEQEFDNASKSFMVAGIYKNKEQMDKNIEFVKAVDAAMILYKNKHRLTTSFQQQELVAAWRKAKNLTGNAKLTGGIDVKSKYNEVNDDYIETLKVKNSNTAILEQYFYSSKVKNIPKIKDDKDFGGEVNVTAWVKWRVKTVNQNNVIQLKFYIKFKEKGGHCCSNTSSTYELTTDPITVLKLPSQYREHFIINGPSDFSSEFHFKYSGKELNKLFVKGPPRRMDLESPLEFITDLVFKTENGKITFSFKPNETEVGLVKKR